MTTEAPGKGVLFSSSTVPVNRVCEYAAALTKTVHTNTSSVLFIFFVFVTLVDFKATNIKDESYRNKLFTLSNQDLFAKKTLAKR
jgi:hypothetical protein